MLSRFRWAIPIGVLCFGAAVRAGSSEDLFVVEVKAAAGAPPLSPEEVHDQTFPTFDAWRARAVKNNPGLAKGLSAARVATIELRVRGRASAHRDVFLSAARRAAGAAGANLLCASPGPAAVPALTFQAYRVVHEGVPLPGDFIGYLAAASFREQTYLENLMKDWTYKKSNAPPALPASSPRVAQRKPRGEAAPEQAAVPEMPPAPPPAAKREKSSAPPRGGKPPVTLDLSLLGAVGMSRLPPPGGTVPGASGPTGAGYAPPLSAGSAALSSTDTAPASPVHSAKTPAGKIPAPVVVPSAPAGRSDAPKILSKPGALGAGTLSLVLPGLGQWRAGDRPGAAGAFLRQAGFLAVSYGMKKKAGDDVERRLDDIYLYRAAKYGAGSAWLGQSVGTVMRHWPRAPAPRSADGAIARAIVFPGGGLWHAGRYELAVNVMAWEGFVLYWGTKTELRRDDRVSLIAFTHFAQIALTGFLASPARKDVAAVPSFDGESVRLTLHGRY